MSTLIITSQLTTLRFYLYQASLFFLVCTGFFLPLSITATDVCMVATAALGLMSGRFFEHFDELRRNPLVWSALAFVMLVIIALTWSVAPWGDRLSALHKYAKLLYIPLFLPLCKNSQWRDRTIWAFLAGMMITVLISYLKAWTGLQIGHYPQPSYVFYTHIETGFLVAFATYLFAYYAWKRPDRQILCWSLVIIFTYQEFFINDGRTGWVAYMVLLILYAIHRIGWKGLFYGVVIAGTLLFSFYHISPTFKNILIQSVENVDNYYHAGKVQTSLGYRLSFFKLSLGLIKDKPLLGYGSGSFATVYDKTGGIVGWKTLRTPHNEYLMVMVEFGVVGLISLLLLFYFQWRESFQIGELKYLAHALLLAFMVSSAYNAFLYLSVSGHFYVLFTALLYAGLRSSENAT